jgi:hypothetical protein
MNASRSLPIVSALLAAAVISAGAITYKYSAPHWIGFAPVRDITKEVTTGQRSVSAEDPASAPANFNTRFYFTIASTE